MDTVTLDLSRCPPRCLCDSCALKAAATSIRRLLFARWLVQHGRIGETIPERDPRLLFARWRVERGELSDWNLTDDPLPLPERLHRAWDGVAA